MATVMPHQPYGAHYFHVGIGLFELALNFPQAMLLIAAARSWMQLEDVHLVQRAVILMPGRVQGVEAGGVQIGLIGIRIGFALMPDDGLNVICNVRFGSAVQQTPIGCGKILAIRRIRQIVGNGGTAAAAVDDAGGHGKLLENQLLQTQAPGTNGKIAIVAPAARRGESPGRIRRIVIGIICVLAETAAKFAAKVVIGGIRMGIGLPVNQKHVAADNAVFAGGQSGVIEPQLKTVFVQTGVNFGSKGKGGGTALIAQCLVGLFPERAVAENFEFDGMIVALQYLPFHRHQRRVLSITRVQLQMRWEFLQIHELSTNYGQTRTQRKQ